MIVALEVARADIKRMNTDIETMKARINELQQSLEKLQRSNPPRRETVTVFMMARVRGDQTDSMRGSPPPACDGVEAVYTLNGELYRSQWFAAEAHELRPARKTPFTAWNVR